MVGVCEMGRTRKGRGRARWSRPPIGPQPAQFAASTLVERKSCNYGQHVYMYSLTLIRKMTWTDWNRSRVLEVDGSFG